MPIKKYTEEQKRFIAENVDGLTTKQLVELVNTKFNLGFTDAKMKSYKSNNRLKSGTPKGLPADRATELYPAEIREFIKENYPGVGHKNMADLLNKTFGVNYSQAQIKTYYARCKYDSGLTGQFSKGHVPANKGKKGIGGWKPSQFKKGNIPLNFKPVGSERININGYVEIKVADPSKWRVKHQVIWEAHHGPIPKGHAVIFGDGNPLNLDLSNLILVSKRQLLMLNRKGLIQKDADLTRTGVIVADLYLKMVEVQARERS